MTCGRNKIYKMAAFKKKVNFTKNFDLTKFVFWTDQKTGKSMYGELYKENAEKLVYG